MYRKLHREASNPGLNGGSLLDLQEDFKITDIRNVEKVRYEVLLKDLRQDAYLDQKDELPIPHSHSIEMYAYNYQVRLDAKNIFLYIYISLNTASINRITYIRHQIIMDKCDSLTEIKTISHNTPLTKK